MVIRDLRASRPTVEEALKILRGERRAQVNLLRILSATRFRVLTKGEIYRSKYPKTHCYSRGSLSHLLECYDLTSRMAFGEEAVQFLVHVARASLSLGDRPMIPHLLEFEPDLSLA